MEESRHRICCFNHTGKNSVYQLGRLRCSKWCRELNNQANILTRCHFIIQEEGVFHSEWKTVCGMPIGSCINFLSFPESLLLWPFLQLLLTGSMNTSTALSGKSSYLRNESFSWASGYVHWGGSGCVQVYWPQVRAPVLTSSALLTHRNEILKRQ